MGVQGAKPPYRGLGSPQIFLFPKMLVDYALEKCALGGSREREGGNEQRRTR